MNTLEAQTLFSVSHKMKKSLESLVVDRELVTPEKHRSNDYYGHAFQFKRYLGIIPEYTLKVSIEHGPHLIKFVWDIDAYSKMPIHLCSSDYSASHFREQTNKETVAIGPYISYLPESEVARKKIPLERILLVFPKHSTHHYIVQYDVESMLTALEPYAPGFDKIRICLYWKEILLGRHKEFETAGLEVVTAGHMFDPYFLPRLINLIGEATATASMYPGTNVLYSLYLNRPTWIYTCKSDYLDITDKTMRTLRAKIDETIYGDPNNMFNKMIRLFSEPVENITPEQNEFAAEVIGYDHIKTSDELMELFQSAEDRFRRSHGLPVTRIPRIQCEQVIPVDKPATKEYPVQMIKEAMKCIREKQYERALSLLEKTKQLGGSIKNLEVLKSMSLVGLNRNIEAIKALNLELAQYPENEDALLLKRQFDNAVPDQSDLTENISNTDSEPDSADFRAAQALMDVTREHLAAGRKQDAFDSIQEAKAKCHKVLGLDYLRGLTFLQMNKPHDAFQCFLEEFRLFPDNQEARRIMEDLRNQIPDLIEKNVSDPEFSRLYDLIHPYTMLGEQRLYNLYKLAKLICAEDLHGNFVECGVAGGGATALLAYMIKNYSKQPRVIYAFDSYEGMPAASEHDIKIRTGESPHDVGWGEGTCAAPIESVNEICEKVGAGDLLMPVKGFFDKTLPMYRDKIGNIALLHADADWYESQRDIFENLYDRLSSGAIVQVDDYGYWSGSRKALDEFMAKRDLKFNLQPIDGNGIWFRKQ